VRLRIRAIVLAGAIRFWFGTLGVDTGGGNAGRPRSPSRESPPRSSAGSRRWHSRPTGFSPNSTRLPAIALRTTSACHPCSSRSVHTVMRCGLDIRHGLQVAIESSTVSGRSFALQILHHEHDREFSPAAAARNCSSEYPSADASASMLGLRDSGSSTVTLLIGRLAVGAETKPGSPPRCQTCRFLQSRPQCA